MTNRQEMNQFLLPHSYQRILPTDRSSRGTMAYGVALFIARHRLCE